MKIIVKYENWKTEKISKFVSSNRFMLVFYVEIREKTDYTKFSGITVCGHKFCEKESLPEKVDFENSFWACRRDIVIFELDS